MQYWTSLISAGEQSLPLSSRDGKQLRIIAPSQRLTREALEAQLAAAISARELAVDCGHMLLTGWQRGSSPGRAPLALMRAAAYLQSREHEIALRVPPRLSDSTRHSRTRGVQGIRSSLGIHPYA